MIAIFSKIFKIDKFHFCRTNKMNSARHRVAAGLSWDSIECKSTKFSLCCFLRSEHESKTYKLIHHVRHRTILTTYHVERGFGSVNQHIKLLRLADVLAEIFAELLSVIDESWNETLEDFQVERIIQWLPVHLPHIICLRFAKIIHTLSNIWHKRNHSIIYI